MGYFREPLNESWAAALGLDFPAPALQILAIVRLIYPSHTGFRSRCTPLAPDSCVAPTGYAILLRLLALGATSLYARKAWRLHPRNRACYYSSPRLALGHERRTSLSLKPMCDGYTCDSCLGAEKSRSQSISPRFIQRLLKEIQRGIETRSGLYSKPAESSALEKRVAAATSHTPAHDSTAAAAPFQA